eukprot:2645639-Prymnesium_polylepis.1
MRPPPEQGAAAGCFFCAQHVPPFPASHQLAGPQSVACLPSGTEALLLLGQHVFVRELDMAVPFPYAWRSPGGTSQWNRLSHVKGGYDT